MSPGDLHSTRYTRRAALSRAASGALALSSTSALLSACGGSSSNAAKGGSLQAWMWGDAPNLNKWLTGVNAKFKATQGGADVKVAMQQTETLISNFTAAAAARRGPDVAAQWATQPVLAQAWKNAVA